jgi:hypothetical protein
MAEASISPFRQDPLSRCRVRVHTALAIVEDGSYGLLKFEDVARLLIAALEDIAELEQGTNAPQALDWNEYPALAEEGR